MLNKNQSETLKPRSEWNRETKIRVHSNKQTYYFLFLISLHQGKIKNLPCSKKHIFPDFLNE